MTVEDSQPDLIQLVEALIFASDHPLSATEIQILIKTSLETDFELADISDCIRELASRYESEKFAFQLKKTSGGYQFLTKPAFHQLATALNGDKFSKKLSATSMETLSIIAYQQPVTKAEIEYIRGVASDYSIQKLLEKELIFIQGRKEDAIGKPLLYATSPFLMDYLGINDWSELPKLKEVVPLQSVEATEGKEAAPETDLSA